VASLAEEQEAVDRNKLADRNKLGAVAAARQLGSSSAFTPELRGACSHLRFYDSLEMSAASPFAPEF
jgi:hypothetical protein